MRVGILAGRGLYPRLLAQRLQENNKEIVVAGLSGQYASKSISGVCAEEIFPLGAFGSIARFFDGQGVSKVFMAGGVNRKGAWRYARPDLAALSMLPGALLGGDDSLLRLVARHFARLGIAVSDPSPYLGNDFARLGLQAGPEISSGSEPDIELAWNSATSHGREDAGQSTVAFRGRVVGFEGRDGTDALLARAPGPGAVFAKVVKPGQDRRFDMPAIGPSTAIIASMVGLRTIVVEAQGVLLLDRERLFSICNRTGVSLLGKSA